jgi:hypothetical protein
MGGGRHDGGGADRGHGRPSRRGPFRKKLASTSPNGPPDCDRKTFR